MSMWDREFETGLRDNYVGTIVTSRWGRDARYDNGNTTVLVWTVTGTDDEGLAFEDQLLISCGKGWESDDGVHLYHQSGKDKYFNQTSHVARVIKRAMELPGAGEVIKSRGEPMDATVWENLTFRLARESINYGGEIGGKDKVLPQEFVGVAGTTTPAPVTTAAPTPAAPTPAATTNGALALQVRATAVAASSYQEFVDKAISLDGVMGDATLMASIADEANGIYAQVKAGS